jgi:microcystin-dependent protein
VADSATRRSSTDYTKAQITRLKRQRRIRMSQPFLGEIRMFGGNFAPLGYALCAGQTLAIAQNTALFSLIGTTYGGDGVSTFNLPDLRGRVPVHAGTLNAATYVIGEVGGAETVPLAPNQLPLHNHSVACNSANGNIDNPGGNAPAASPTSLYTAPGNANSNMNGATISLAGGSQAHDNMSPFLAISFIIAVDGIFPSRN